MKKISVILLFICHFSVFAKPQTDTVVMKMQPFIQSPIGNSITITWLTNYPSLSYVEYGTSVDSLNKAVTLKNGQVVAGNKINHIKLNDLKPNTKYYYRAVSKVITHYGAYKKEFGKLQTSDLYSFTTPKQKGEVSDFTALIFNDLHREVKTAKALKQALKGLKYDFVIFNGDCIDDPKDEEQVVNTVSQFNEIVGAQSVPVIYLRGNHEIRNAYSVWLYDILQTIAGDRSYGAFSWGDVRFVLLDCGEDKPDSHPVYYGMNDFTQFRKDQLEFLKTETKSEPFTKAKFRVLVHHIPIYDSNYNSKPCLELWGEVLNRAKIDVSINARTHDVTYIKSGDLNNNYPVLIGGGPDVDKSCVTVVEKKGNQLIIKQIDANGCVLNCVVKN